MTTERPSCAGFQASNQVWFCAYTGEAEDCNVVFQDLTSSSSQTFEDDSMHAMSSTNQSVLSEQKLLMGFHTSA